MGKWVYLPAFFGDKVICLYKGNLAENKKGQNTLGTKKTPIAYFYKPAKKANSTGRYGFIMVDGDDNVQVEIVFPENEKNVELQTGNPEGEVTSPWEHLCRKFSNHYKEASGSSVDVSSISN